MLLSVDQAAERLNVSVKWVRNQIQSRQIEFIKVGRNVRIAESEIDRIIESGRVPIGGKS